MKLNDELYVIAWKGNVYVGADLDWAHVAFEGDDMVTTYVTDQTAANMLRREWVKARAVEYTSHIREFVGRLHAEQATQLDPA